MLWLSSRHRARAPVAVNVSGQPMRTSILLLAAFLVPPVWAQKAQPVDIVTLVLGKSFPIAPLTEAKPREGSLPFYSFAVPTPESSPLKVFPDYDVDVTFDTKSIYALRAKRAFASTEACAVALKSIVPPLTTAYKVKATKSEFSIFKAEARDVMVDASCFFVEGSPYPTLQLLISSKSERARVSELMKKRYAR